MGGEVLKLASDKVREEGRQEGRQEERETILQTMTNNLMAMHPGLTKEEARKKAEELITTNAPIEHSIVDELFGTASNLDMSQEEVHSERLSVIEQLSESAVDNFHRLRSNGLQNPMTDDEIDYFAASVRKERHGSSN